MEFILPVLFFLAAGAAAGGLLTIAGKFLFVKTDETLEKIIDALPGANCGGCGFAGCSAYAEAIAKGEAPTNLCSPGGLEVNKKISAIVGTKVVETEPMTAYVHCNGCHGATEDKYIYSGTASCNASEKFYGGRSSCNFGCCGYGDCVEVCENDAISLVEGVAVINPVKCGACGKCVKVCPNYLITLVKKSALVAVRCNSSDIGKQTRLVCKNGCIACKICEKKCNYDAIHVINNRAEIDYSKCVSCGECMTACPRKCIEALPQCVEVAKNQERR